VSAGVVGLGEVLPEGAIGELQEGIGGTFQVYLGSETFISRPADTNPHRYYAPYMQELRTRRTSLGARDLGGAAAFTSGELRLGNADGALDQYFVDGHVDGREIIVRAIPRNDPRGGESLDDATIILRGVMEWPGFDRTGVAVPLRCRGALLEVPVQSQEFAGTGGAEGGDDVKGKPKPVAFGKCWGVSPVYLGVISGKHCYLASGGDCLPINDVPNFYDKGVALTKVASGPTAGQYSIDTATGIITIGGTRPELPTCNIEGYAPGGSFKTTTANIWKELVETFAGEINAFIDGDSVDDMNADQAAEVGIYVGATERTVAQVVNELLAGVTALAGCNRQGKHHIAQLKAPGGVIRAVFDETNLRNVERIRGPQVTAPPAWKIRVGWRRNYTPTKDVASGAADSQVQFMAEEFRFAEASDTTIQDRHKRSQVHEVRGLFAAEADAQSEANRLLGLFDGRALYKLSANNVAPELDLGQTIEITWPRFGMTKALGVIVGWQVLISGSAVNFDPVVFV
jgi:hypothetical protein